MDDTHDQLVKEYLEYFKANEKWVARRSIRTYYATQKHLKQIKRLAQKLERENLNLYHQIRGKKDK